MNYDAATSQTLESSFTIETILGELEQVADRIGRQAYRVHRFADRAYGPVPVGVDETGRERPPATLHDLLGRINTRLDEVESAINRL